MAQQFTEYLPRRNKNVIVTQNLPSDVRVTLFVITKAESAQVPSAGEWVSCGFLCSGVLPSNKTEQTTDTHHLNDSFTSRPYAG